jgi:hypothetical protein
MKVSGRTILNRAWACITGALLLFSFFGTQNYVTAAEKQSLNPDEAKLIGIEAYVYGYPLVTMEKTRQIMTNVREPSGTRAPMGQFVRMRTFPSAEFRDVTAPNADTLYTTAWLDVGKEPWILSIPDAHDRYYLFPMLDAWTTVFENPGKRTTGTGPQRYAITGPGWKRSLPAGVKEYKSPTSIVWILGRIYSTGTPEDYAAVHKMQDECSVEPLSSYVKPFTPPPGTVDPNIDMKTPTREQVNAMDAKSYFTLLAKLMKDNPPTAEDAPMVAKLARIGIVPGEDFNFNKLDPAVQQALLDVPKEAVGKIREWWKEGIARGVNKLENGWILSLKTGIYGTNFMQRAYIAYYGLGANRPEDAIYPTSETDVAGQNYSGANKYIMHINKGQMPPVNGFWSLTMYDDNYFFVPNPLNRYTLSQRNKFNTNPDGSVDLLLQKDSPGGEKEANWLPAPDGKFVLMLRMYWPKENPPSILDGTWTLPGVRQQGGNLQPTGAPTGRRKVPTN